MPLKQHPVAQTCFLDYQTLSPSFPPLPSVQTLPPMTTTQSVLDKLAKYDTPTICNVIQLFDVRPRNRGYMDARVKCNFPEFPPIVGYACTAAFRSDAPPA